MLSARTVAGRPVAAQRSGLSRQCMSRMPAVACRALKKGDSLPAFTLQDDQGNNVSSKDMVKDNGVVLFVYPQACTSGCTHQAKEFTKNVREFADRGYRVYGMSADPPAAQAGWKAEHGFPFALLSDSNKQVLSALGSLGADGGIKRSHFVVARGGQVEDAQIGIGSKDSVPVALAFVASK